MNANTYGHGPLAEHAEARQAEREFSSVYRTRPEGAGFVLVTLGSALVVVVLALVAAVTP